MTHSQFVGPGGTFSVSSTGPMPSNMAAMPINLGMPWMTQGGGRGATVAQAASAAIGAFNQFLQPMMQPERELSDGWRGVWSAQHGREYYWHQPSGRTQWEAPEGIEVPPRPAPSQNVEASIQQMM